MLWWIDDFDGQVDCSDGPPRSRACTAREPELKPGQNPLGHGPIAMRTQRHPRLGTYPGLAAVRSVECLGLKFYLRTRLC